jgi:hypothetical protein
MTWLTGWTYRKSHVINYAAGAGTLYQKQITVHYGSGTDGDDDVYLNSHCRTDFGDVRFTDDDGTTLLDYWMRSKVDGDYAVFWVEVADDLSTVAQTIYVYYGKSDATTISNFDNTFIFGDPFDNVTLDTNRWTSVDGNPTYTINITNHYLEVTDADTNINYTGKGFHSKIFTMPSSYIIEDAYDNPNGYYEYEATSIATEINVGFHMLHHGDWSSADWGIAYTGIGDHQSNSQSYYSEAGVGGNSDYCQATQSGGSASTYWIIQKTDTTIVITESGTQRVSEVNSETPDRFHLGIVRWSTYAFGTQRFGAFKIRKYVSPEPSHGSWGSEETSGAVLKEVTDSISLAESILRDKTLTISDSVGLADAPLKYWTPQISDSIALSDSILRNKAFQILDSLGLSDTILRDKQFSVSDSISLSELITVITEIIKQVTDSLSLSDIVSLNKALVLADQIQLTDNVYVNKILIISDYMALVEVVEKSVQGVVKTRIFLIIGDLAIQLTGD